MISRINMVILLESNLAAAVEFYKALGLCLKFHLHESWAEFLLPDGTKVCLCPSSSTEERKTGIVFEVPDVRAFYEKHKDSIAFLSEPLERVHGLMVSVKDPGNNIIDLYQPTPEKIAQMVKKVAENTPSQGCCKGGSVCPCRGKGEA